MKRIALICVTHDSADHVPGFAAAVDRCTGAVRVVYVDSGSSDDTLRVAAEVSPDADICRLPANRGFAAGFNAGVEHVRASGGADVYVIANVDVRPDENCLSVLAAGLSVPGVGITCPTLRDEDGRRQDSLRNEPSAGATWALAVLGGARAERLGLPVEVIGRPSAYESQHDVGWATGGLLAISEACLRTTGAWSEHMFMYEEEVDFCLRAAAAGFSTRFIPEAGAVRETGHDRPSPWRVALIRGNRVARLTGVTRASVRCALLLTDMRRMHRKDARAGLWALLTGATPQGVMARYLPRAKVEVSPVGTTSRPILVRSGRRTFPDRGCDMSEPR